MSNSYSLHRCPWKNCDWSRYIIEGSKPSKEIDRIAFTGHLKDRHDGALPIVDEVADIISGLFRNPNHTKD